MRVAVVTGRHPFDVAGFHALFRSFEGWDCIIQHMEDWTFTPKEVRETYDVVVFYNFHADVPPSEGAPWYDSQIGPALGQLGETRQGIVVLHHAILAFPTFDVWTELVGVEDRSFGYHLGQQVTVNVADGEHPIARGLGAWTMTDETYTMSDPGGDSRILLTTEHPLSMRSLAWTRRFRESRVLCLQCGHDNDAYSDPSFRQVLGRGIRWCAGQLD